MLEFSYIERGLLWLLILLLNRPCEFPRASVGKRGFKCSAFHIEMIFHSHANKTHFHNKGCALGLILKVRVFGTRMWPIHLV